MATDIRKWIEALILQAEKDARCLRSPMNGPSSPNLLSLVFADMLNQLLPARYHIGELQFIMAMDRGRVMTKSLLERSLKKSWRPLGVSCRNGATLSPAEPHIKVLAKTFFSPLRRAQGHRE